jgi:phenylpropionate dioxygenase-like ring-hydroxylating dioxygenase large terminal subunit
MGEESVILTRDRRGQLHVFLNTCRHRGMKVCRYDEGNTLVFTCPYHGWSYGTDGKLVGVPLLEQAYRGKLDKSRWGLVEVAQMENFYGTIWATWDPEAPSFREYVGGVEPYLRRGFSQSNGEPGGLELIGGVQKWMIPCNWKFAAENFVGDAYHSISHRSADLAGVAPSGVGRHVQDVDETRGRKSSRIAVSFPALGHGGNWSLQPEDAPIRGGYYPNNPNVEEYFRQAYEGRRQRLGPLSRVSGGGTIFPNTSGFGERVAVWNPRGPLQTEVWRFYFVDQNAPEEAKDLLRHYALRYSGPGGMTEQDDMENWNYATAASRGTIARRYAYNYQIGLGTEEPAGLIPGTPEGAFISPVPSEQNQRNFYRRWAELMDADSWNDVPPKRRR